MNQRAILSLVLALTALVLAAPLALGAALVRKDIPTMVEEADVICLGTVVALESRWDEAHGLIYSLATVEVGQILKGDEVSNKLVVRYLGGTVGDVGMSVPGAPTFQAGEDVLLFLAPEEDGSYSVAGMSQGKYTIERDEPSGITYAKPELRGLTFIGGEEDAMGEPMPLQELLTWIEELLASME